MTHKPVVGSASLASCLSPPKLGGYGLGVFNYFNVRGQYLSGDISKTQMYIEQGSNAFSTFGGVPGVGWGIGWETGRAITKTRVYQKIKHDYLLPYWWSQGVYR